MKNRFNFLNLPIVSALKDAASLLPGLDQVDLLYFDHETGELKVKRVRNNMNSELQDIPINGDTMSAFKLFRKQTKGIRWYEPSDLPFADMKSKTGSASIFDEILKSILCIGIENLNDHSHDVFIFYFRINSMEFGPMRSDKVLETNQKIVIERLLQSSLNTILNNYYQNREAMMEFNQQLNRVMQNSQTRLQEQEEKMKALILNLDSIIYGLLDDLKENEDIIKISEEAKSILRNQLFNIPLLKEKLSQALNFAKAMNFGMFKPEILLHEDYFQDLKTSTHSTSNTSKIVPDAYSVNTKIYKFLDDLEKAAQRLYEKGSKLTSSNVGSLLEQPVTAAAISDKLKNHGKKINLLLQQYPDNWKIIRSRFRPVVNIQERVDDYKVA